MTLPPVFLRKSVNPWELRATKMQECDFEEVTGFNARLTKQSSTDYPICQ